jgi:mannosyltransferase
LTDLASPTSTSTDADSPEAADDGSRTARLVVIGATALLAGLAFTDLGGQSLWQDEGSTWDVTGRALGDFLTVVRETETNGSLYNFLLTLWRHLAGDSELALRLPSAVFAVLLVPFTYLLGRRLVGPRAGALAAMLVAVHGAVLLHGRDARTYALVILLVTLRSLAFVRDVDRPTATRWVVWVLLGALAVYAHLHAGLLVVAELVLVLALPASDRAWRRRLLGWATMGLLLVPLVAAVMSRSNLEGLDNIGFGPYVFRDAAESVTGRNGVLAVLVVGAAVLFAASKLWTERDGTTTEVGPPVPTRPWRWYLVAAAGAPTAVAGIVSVVQPVLLGRYVAYSLVPMMLLAASAAFSLSRPPWRWGVAGALVVAVGAGGLSVRFDDNEDWRGAVAVVLEGARPGDRVVAVDDYHLLTVRYYVESEDAVDAFPEVVLPSIAITAYSLEDVDNADVDEEAFACAMAGTTGLWVLDGPDFYDLARRDDIAGLAEATFGEPVEVWPLAGEMHVRQYRSDEPQPDVAGCPS